VRHNAKQAQSQPARVLVTTTWDGTNPVHWVQQHACTHPSFLLSVTNRMYVSYLFPITLPQVKHRTGMIMVTPEGVRRSTPRGFALPGHNTRTIFSPGVHVLS